MTNGPTPHVKWRELRCRDAKLTPYPSEWRLSRGLPLAVEFERIRAAVGRAIVIGSAYRTPEHNRAVGGARHSQHVHGRALDVYPPKGWTVDRFYQVIRNAARDRESRIQAIGRYDRFIHFDIRPARADGKLTVWRGTRAWAEVRS